MLWRAPELNTTMTSCNQAGVSRSKAVEALKTNDGDIVNAIMELTISARMPVCSDRTWHWPGDFEMSYLSQHELQSVFKYLWKIDDERSCPSTSCNQSSSIYGK
eukprot:6214685-Pleurochrysis_carterae.AAC.2